MSNQPVAKFGTNIRVSAWRARNGALSFTLEKTYKDKNTNEWKKTNVWWDKDLELLLEKIKEALDFSKDDHRNEGAMNKPQGDMPF